MALYSFSLYQKMSREQFEKVAAEVELATDCAASCAFCNDRMEAIFDIESPTFDEAVKSAVAQIKETSFRVETVEVHEDSLGCLLA